MTLWEGFLGSKIMNVKTFLINSFLSISLFYTTSNIQAEPSIDLNRLKQAYPDMIQNVTSSAISWKDGTQLHIRSTSALMEQLSSLLHKKHPQEDSISLKDIQCHNYEPFLKKMYGSSLSEVKEKLVIIYWMQKVFGKRYPIKVTTVNGVDQRIRRISAELEKLPPSNYKYLAHPAGSFYWRTVKSEKYLSAHSFGIAMDINSKLGNYWLWDWEKAKKPKTRLTLHNNVPMEIVHIFEQEGFLWGGRWYYYDTMHFEYRPELFTSDGSSGLQYNPKLNLYCYV
jgi:peptidoglycan L-alanyl-D-glutamate endopeptidase CwlK